MSRIFRAAAAVLVLTFVSACSPKSLFLDSDDKALAKTPTTYRRPNQVCAGLDLSESTLSIRSFVSLVNCLNANGEIGPLARLVNRLQVERPAALAGVVALLNRAVLSDQRALYEFDRSFVILRERGLLREAFGALGKLLENDELVAHTFALFRSKQLAWSLARMSDELSAENVAYSLDIAISIAESRAFSDLQRRLRGESAYGREFASTAIGVLSWLRGDKAWQLESGEKIFEVIDDVFGRNEAAIRSGVSDVATLFHVAFKRGQVSLKPGGDTSIRDAVILDGISSLYGSMHRRVDCFQGAAFVPDADFHMIRELAFRGGVDSAEFYQRSNLLTLIAANPFCPMPSDVGKYYEAMIRLSDTPAVETSTRVASSFYRHGLAENFVAFMADPGVKRTFPMGAEFAERGIWADLFFLATLPDDFARERITALFKYGDFFNALLAVPDKELVAWLNSWRKLLYADEPVLAPLLRSFRRSFHATDVHPVVTLVRRVFAFAGEDQETLAALAEMAELPEFRESTRMFVAMARDGRLEELSSSLLSLFHEFGLRAADPEVKSLTESRFVLHRRHDLSAEDVKIIVPVEEWPANDPCRRLDLGKVFFDYSSSELRDYFACFNRGTEKQYDGFIDAVEIGFRFLRTSPFTAEQTQALFERWVHSVDSGQFFKTLETFRVWSLDGGAHAFLGMLHDWVREAKDSLAALLRMVGAWVGSEKFPETLRFLQSVGSQLPNLNVLPRLNHADLVAFARTLRGTNEEADDLLQWLRDRASSTVTISYFFSGEKKPRPVQLTTLERFELMALNGNFNFIARKNFLIEFLEQLSESWGDEPRAKWPKEIQSAYERGRRPPTLSESVAKMRKTVEGASHLPFPHEIKMRVYNLEQLFPVLQDDIPGLRPLRRMLFELRGNLQLVAQFAEIKFMSQAGRALLSVSSDDAGLMVGQRAFMARLEDWLEKPVGAGGVEDVLRLLRIAELRGVGDIFSVSVPPELQSWIANAADSGDLEKLVLSIGKDPEKYEQLLRVAGEAIAKGDLQALVRFARRGLISTKR